MKAQEIMSKNPRTVTPDTAIQEAARLMKEEDVGVLPVVESTSSKRLLGVVTDRDIAVRVVAEGKDPSSTTVGDVASTDLHTLSPDDSVEDAIELVRQHALGRVPVVEGARPVGIVSIGDLAIERDTGSALADISSEPANN